MAKVRKSYIVKEKLAILELYRLSGLSRRKFARSKGLTESTLRTWESQKPKMDQVPAEKLRKTRYMKFNQKGYFEEIDKAVLVWVKDRNDIGLRVKDKFIQMFACQVRDQMINALDDQVAGDSEKKAKLQSFKASRIWCHRFKKRNGLRSRRHTTTHRLPLNFREAALKFINEVQQICREKQISCDRIINFDQVPRYYENDKSFTIAEKGRVEVLLRKSSTSHKKFTFTPFITASGKFLMKHALFSNLKLIPKHDERCKVDINKTGMWNNDCMQKRIDEVVKICRGLFSTRSDVLVVLDSYPGHVKFLKEKQEIFKAKHVHFAVIPACLTGLLQPLDVALNRSFQQYFNDRTDEYQAESLRTGLNKTPLGNVKMPGEL